jgi:type II restriction enzyme
MLSIPKATQNGNKPVWKYVPLQDFTPASDIDWTQPISAIDRQLYRNTA